MDIAEITAKMKAIEKKVVDDLLDEANSSGDAAEYQRLCMKLGQAVLRGETLTATAPAPAPEKPPFVADPAKQALLDEVAAFRAKHGDATMRGAGVMRIDPVRISIEKLELVRDAYRAKFSPPEVAPPPEAPPATETASA